MKGLFTKTIFSILLVVLAIGLFKVAPVKAEDSTIGGSDPEIVGGSDPGTDSSSGGGSDPGTDSSSGDSSGGSSNSYEIPEIVLDKTNFSFVTASDESDSVNITGWFRSDEIPSPTDYEWRIQNPSTFAWESLVSNDDWIFEEIKATSFSNFGFSITLNRDIEPQRRYFKICFYPGTDHETLSEESVQVDFVGRTLYIPEDGTEKFALGEGVEESDRSKGFLRYTSSSSDFGPDLLTLTAENAEHVFRLAYKLNLRGADSIDADSAISDYITKSSSYGSVEVKRVYLAWKDDISLNSYTDFVGHKDSDGWHIDNLEEETDITNRSDVYLVIEIAATGHYGDVVSLESGKNIIRVNKKLVDISEQPEDVTVETGDEAEFRVDVKQYIDLYGNDQNYYQWEESTDGGETWAEIEAGRDGFSGQMAQTLSIPNVTADMDGNQYRLKFKSWQDNYYYSEPATLHVNPTDPLTDDVTVMWEDYYGNVVKSETINVGDEIPSNPKMYDIPIDYKEYYRFANTFEAYITCDLGTYGTNWEVTYGGTFVLPIKNSLIREANFWNMSAEDVLTTEGYNEAKETYLSIYPMKRDAIEAGHFNVLYTDNLSITFKPVYNKSLVTYCVQYFALSPVSYDIDDYKLIDAPYADCEHIPYDMYENNPNTIDYDFAQTYENAQYKCEFEKWDYSDLETSIINAYNEQLEENAEYGLPFNGGMGGRFVRVNAVYTKTEKPSFLYKFLGFKYDPQTKDVENHQFAQQVVPQGTAPTLPTLPEAVEGPFATYAYTGWHKVIENRLYDPTDLAIQENALTAWKAKPVNERPDMPIEIEIPATWFTTAKQLVTFVEKKENGDIKRLIKQGYYNPDEAVELPAPPTKAATNEAEYAFKGWKSSVDGQIYTDSVPTAYNNGAEVTITESSKSAETVQYEAVFDVTERINVKFVDFDGQAISDRRYNKGEKIEIPANPTRKPEGNQYFEFKDWTPAISQTAEENVTYKAQYDTYKKINIKFINWNREILSEKDYFKGETIDVPLPPTRRNTDDVQYYFKGWTPEIKATAEEDAIYQAEFNEVVAKYYKITFKNGSTVLEERSVREGTDLDAPSVSDYEDDKNWYKFDGWEPALYPVSKAQTYTAKFVKTAKPDPEKPRDPEPVNPVPKTYTIVFQRPDGTVISSTLATEGSKVAPPTVPSYTEKGVTFSFKEWQPKVNTTAKADAVYTAIFKAEKTEPSTPTTKTPTPEKPEKTEDPVIEIKTPDLVTASFYDNDGTLFKRVEVKRGDSLEEKEIPEVKSKTTKAGTYTFKGWNPEVPKKLTESTTFKAEYDLKKAEATPTPTPTPAPKPVVKFVDQLGNVVKQIEVDPGTVLKATDMPEAPVVDGYEFNGWDYTNEPILANTKIEPLYKKKLITPMSVATITAGLLTIGAITSAVFTDWWVLLFNLIFIKKRKKWHGLLTDEENKFIKTPGLKDGQDYTTVQMEIDANQQAGGTLENLRKRLEATGIMSILPLGTKMSISIVTLDGTEVSPEMDADEDKLYDYLADYEGKGVTALVDIFNTKRAVDIKLTFGL